jgi:regulator of replication initiation timing
MPTITREAIEWMQDQLESVTEQRDQLEEELVEALEELEVAQEENGILRARLNQLMSDRTVSV